MRIIIGGGCEWLLCGKCNGLAADVRVGDIQTTDAPDVVRACTCPDRPKKFPLEKPMTDFDAKLAELRKLLESPVSGAGAVDAMRLMTDLLALLAPGSIEGRCTDPSHNLTTSVSSDGTTAGSYRMVCGVCFRPKV